MSSVDSSTQKQHLFGRWRFDAITGDVFDGQTNTRLEPQVAKLLDYFLSHQDKLTSRDELIDAVWENRIVSDDAVNRCVSILRQILSPDDKHALIETVIRRGYISHFPAPDEKPISKRSPGRKNLLILAALVSLLVVVIYAGVGKRTEPPAPAQSTQREGTPIIAVLPFTSSDMAGDSEFLASGIHDDLLTQLAQLQSLQVISRTSVLEYRDGNRNLRTIGQDLGADAILEGGIQRNGDQIRINMQLIDAQTDAHLWAEQYDRELSPANIFAVQTEITRAIASALNAALTEQDDTQLSVLPTENMAAYNAYHRALEIRGIRNSGDPAYIEALEQAVDLDPSFVRAWVEIAGALSLENFSSPDPDSIHRLEQVLEKVRSLAPDSAEYLIAKAYFTYYVLKSYDKAAELITRAQRMRPNDAHVVELKSWIQRRQGDYDGRIESIRLTRKLDPKNLSRTVVLINSLMIVHRYDEAGLEFETAPIKNFTMSVSNSLLQIQDHQEPARLLDALMSLQKEYGRVADPLDLWDANIAKHDYHAADQIMMEMQASGEKSVFWANTGVMVPRVDLHRLMTYWFMQADDRLDILKTQLLTELDNWRDSDGDFRHYDQNLLMAFVTAVDGNIAETERLIRAWRRAANEDLASLALNIHYSCRALGIAAATTAAVQCIRQGLVEPSLIMPFFEPFLPYYDAIRGEAEFVELLADIQKGGPLNGVGPTRYP